MFVGEDEDILMFCRVLVLMLLRKKRRGGRRGWRRVVPSQHAKPDRAASAGR